MAKTPEPIKAPHVGGMMEARIKSRRVSKSALARALERSPVAIQGYAKKESMQVAMLWRLAMALKHNFFADIAAQMPPEFTTEVVVDTSKDDRIVALEREVELLSKQLELLKELLRK